jgi:hypothetical protein
METPEKRQKQKSKKAKSVSAEIQTSDQPHKISDAATLTYTPYR